jgi:hypothetical protein
LITSRDDLFDRGKLKTAVVTIDTIGGDQVSIRELTLAARSKVSEMVSGGKLADVSAFVVATCVPALDGVSPEEVSASMSPSVVEEISTAVLRLSGLTEDAEKN